MPGWLILFWLYVLWNLCHYLDPLFFGESVYRGYLKTDLMYWFNERVFVIVVFVLVRKYMKGTVYARFRWIAKTFIWIASLKMAYLLAVIAGWVYKNDLGAAMAFIFILSLGYILRKWERH